MEYLAQFPMFQWGGLLFLGIRWMTFEQDSEGSGESLVLAARSSGLNVVLRRASSLGFRPWYILYQEEIVSCEFFLTRRTVFCLIVLRSDIILLAVNAQHGMEKHKKNRKLLQYSKHHRRDTTAVPVSDIDRCSSSDMTNNVQ
ncbi:hypothetical protein TNCV_2613891 [Trichonephila clavipes]|nr:hypothetical protein TNCV_2613891 [Trichonephila clavipes]